MRPRSTAASNPSKPDADTVKDSNDFLSLPVLWRSGSKSPRRAPSTAAEANSAAAKPPSSAIAIFFTDFALSQRAAAPTSRRISAELKRSALPAPAKRTRDAATPATLCSSVCSSGLPATSPESIQGSGGEPGLFLSFENGNDQGVRLDLLDGNGYSGNLHHFRLCHGRAAPPKFQKWEFFPELACGDCVNLNGGCMWPVYNPLPGCCAKI